jgi:heptaprenyl diphosphate synthase
VFEPCDLRADLSAVDELAASLWTEDAIAAEVCGDLFHAGGKRLRPALVLLASRVGTADAPARIGLALATELLHVATLLHDDVVDEATVRRHRASTNSRFGNAVATYAGGYLFAKATELFAAADVNIDPLVSDAIRRVWRGQAREVENAHNLDVDEVLYYAIVDGKTGALYELACRAGAVAGGLSPDRVDALCAFGRNFGVAFQIVDDVLDIVGDESVVGKRAGSDLRSGVYTLPIIFALAESDDDARRLRVLLENEHLAETQVAEALSILRASPGIPRAISTATSVLDRARQHMATLPAVHARDALFGLLQNVLAPLDSISAYS